MNRESNMLNMSLAKTRDRQIYIKQNYENGVGREPRGQGGVARVSGRQMKLRAPTKKKKRTKKESMIKKLKQREF